jgi:hypothetical protein
MEGLAELARTGGPAWVLVVALVGAVTYLFRQLSIGTRCREAFQLLWNLVGNQPKRSRWQRMP